MINKAQTQAPPREPVTPMEKWYMDCLVSWTRARKRAPTVKELSTWCKRSSTAVFSALRSLEVKGYLTRSGKTSRYIDRRFVVVR